MSEVQNTNGIPSIGFISEMLSGKADKSSALGMFNDELTLAIEFKGINSFGHDSESKLNNKFDFLSEESELPEIPGFVDLNVIGLNPEISELSQSDIDNLLSMFNQSTASNLSENNISSSKSTQLNNYIQQVDYNSPKGIILKNSDFALLTKIQSKFEISNFNKNNIEDSNSKSVFSFNDTDFDFENIEIPDEIKQEMKKFELKNNQININNANSTNEINISTEFSENQNDLKLPKFEINAEKAKINTFANLIINEENISFNNKISNNKSVEIENHKLDYNSAKANLNSFIQPNEIEESGNLKSTISNVTDTGIEVENIEINNNFNAKNEIKPESISAPINEKFISKIESVNQNSIFDFNDKIENNIVKLKNESNVSIFDFDNSTENLSVDSDKNIFDFERNKSIRFKAGDADRTNLKNDLQNMQNISQNNNFSDRNGSINSNPVEIELNNKENIENNNIQKENFTEFDSKNLNSNNSSSNNGSKSNNFEQMQNENRQLFANMTKKQTNIDGENYATVQNEPEIIEVQNVKSDINGVIQTQLTKISTNPKISAKTTELTEYSMVKQIVPEEFPNTSIQLIKNLPENGSKSAKLILQPQALGTVIVEINMTQNKMRMEVKADTQEAVKIIENQMATLKDKLAGNGIIAEKIDVSLNQENLQNFGNAGQFSRQGKREDKTARSAFIQSLNGIGTETQDAGKSSIKRNFSKQGSLIETYI